MKLKRSTKLHPALRAKLSRLSLALDAIEDYDDLQHLNELAYDVSSPPQGMGVAALLDVPIMAGTVRLYRLTVGSHLWLRDVVSNWFADGSWLGSMALAFALAHAREPDSLFGLQTKGEAKRVIKRWARRCGATYDELFSATMEAIGVDPLTAMAAENPNASEDDEDDPADYGAMIMLLVLHFGKDKDYWLWEATPEEIAEALRQYTAKQSEERQIAAMKAGAKLPPDTNDPHVQASERYRKAFAVFAEKVNGR